MANHADASRADRLKDANLKVERARLALKTRVNDLTRLLREVDIPTERGVEETARPVECPRQTSRFAKRI